MKMDTLSILHSSQNYNRLHLFHCTWKASSLVGVSTSANIPYGSSHSFCRIGRANAKVLPLPVLAHPIQSSPERMRGMQLIWIGVGCFKPETFSKKVTWPEKYLTSLNQCPSAKICTCKFNVINCQRKQIHLEDLVIDWRIKSNVGR
jgi:hypothetical protein